MIASSVGCSACSVIEPVPVSRLREGDRGSPTSSTQGLRGVGVVVHPTRSLDAVLAEIRAWASANAVTIGQIAIPGQTRRVADPVEAAACDLLTALGGDGTALAARCTRAPRAPVRCWAWPAGASAS